MDDLPPDDALEGRILLLAPTRRDAAASGPVFATVGLELTPCADLDEFCREVGRGAAVGILPEEAIVADRAGRLAGVLAAQPPWSDLPLIVLTAVGMHGDATPGRLEAMGHITLMRRPVDLRSLASAVRAALRDRRRQYAMRAALGERECQAAALRDADRLKDEFLAMLSHELRNQLASVKNAVGVLKHSPEEADRAWATAVVERQVGQLVRIVDDLLDVSRITAGKIQLRREHTDAGPILDRAVEAARPLIDERGHTLTVAIERGAMPLHVDRARVEQIVVNLLTNAAKYTEAGGHIWLDARREGDSAVISVRDDGLGIAPENLPEMFQLFSQGDRSLGRSEGGLGLGLTIVRTLAELHGGSVDARSEGPGKGSEFTLRLPLDRTPTAATASAPAPPTGHDRTRSNPATVRRVLVVDDSVDTARGMVRLLRALGHEAESAHDGHQALDAARVSQPEVILLDIGLPGIDGYQVAAALRAGLVPASTRIIALSGFGQPDDHRRSREAGCDQHLVKPVDLDALIALLGPAGRR